MWMRAHTPCISWGMSKVTSCCSKKRSSIMLQAAHKGETERKKSETKLHNHNYACFFFFVIVCLFITTESEKWWKYWRSQILHRKKKTVKGRVGQNKRSFGSFINKQTNKNVILYVHLCVIYKNTRETCLKWRTWIKVLRADCFV